MWATCNVGASSPSDYGDYFAWGDIKPKSWHTIWRSITYRRSIDSIAGNPRYDAATANWGGSWRLPTDDEIDELIHKCDWELTTLYGNRGCKVTGPTGNSIFLPAAGKHCRWSPFHRAGTCGRYWSASFDVSEKGVRWGEYLRFSSVRFFLFIYLPFSGYSVRPVLEKIQSTSDVELDRTTAGRQGESKQIQVSQPTGTINGHDYVDLGLSVKWATCNVGATAPPDYGNYYAWGSTKTKWIYLLWNSISYRKCGGSIAGNSQYDAARAFWGGSWRLPTKDEIDELIDKCKWKWTTQGCTNGYEITGPNGNSIFLPAAGRRIGTSLYEDGEHGYYWSATPDEDDTLSAYGLGFDGGDFSRTWYNRNYGRSVRPVTE